MMRGLGFAVAGRAIARRAEASPAVAAATLLALWVVFISALMWRPTVEAVIGPDRMQHAGGHSYVASLAGLEPIGYRLRGDSNETPHRSDLQLLRDSIPVGEAHKAHADIQSSGGGSFSHWHTHLYFSTPGNSDPRNDGHRYAVRATAVPSAYVAVALLAAFAFIASVTVAVLFTRPFSSVISRAGVVGGAISPWLKGRRGRIAAFAIVGAVALIPATQNWSIYEVAPDTRSYLANQFLEPALRPPVVATWVSVFSDLEAARVRWAAIAQADQINRSQTGSADDPILKAVQAQRLFLALACAIFAFVAAGRASTVGVALGMAAALLSVHASLSLALCAFLAALSLGALAPAFLHRARRIDVSCANANPASAHAGFLIILPAMALTGTGALFIDEVLNASYLSEEQHYLLSEALAMAGQLLFAASAIAFIWQRRGWALVLAGVLAALCYLTRPAAAFTLLIFGALLIFAIAAKGRRAIGAVLVASAVATLLVFSAPIASALRGTSSASSAPTFNWGPVAFALEVAKSDDERLMPDDDSRRFLAMALGVRDADRSARQAAPVFRSLNLGGNLYYAAMPAAFAVLHAQPPSSELMGAYGADVDALFGKVAWPILKHRADEYAAIVVESFAVATGVHAGDRATRLFFSPWHWAALVGLLVLAFVGVAADTKLALAAALLIAMHITHVAVVAAFDVPLPRYVHATEIFIVLSLVILFDHHLRVVARAARANWNGLVRSAAVARDRSIEAIRGSTSVR